MVCLPYIEHFLLFPNYCDNHVCCTGIKTQAGDPTVRWLAVTSERAWNDGCEILEAKKSCSYQTAARLHCDFITEGFLATLGVLFLTLLYRSIDNDNDSIFGRGG